MAIKKVLQDKRYKNRELQIMQMLNHPNVVALKHYFYTTTEKDELYLNLVLEYVPQTIYQVSKHYYQSNNLMPLIYIKLYTYQVRNASYLYQELPWTQCLIKVVTCLSYFCRCVEHWLIYTMVLGYVIEISNHRMFW